MMKAKVYKVELYVVDVGNEIGNQSSLKYHLENCKYIYPKVVDIQESEEFEWDDDLPINQTDSAVEELRKLF